MIDNIGCKVCGLYFKPLKMQLIREHGCFICQDCVGLVMKSYVGVPNYTIEIRRKKI